MVLNQRSGKPVGFPILLSTVKVGMSHLITNHWLQRGVLVLQCGRVRPRGLGHHLILIMVHRQSLRHLLYVLPQRSDGLPYQQQHYQPGQWWSLMIVRDKKQLTMRGVQRPRYRVEQREGPFELTCRCKSQEDCNRLIWNTSLRSIVVRENISH